MKALSQAHQAPDTELGLAARAEAWFFRSSSFVVSITAVGCMAWGMALAVVQAPPFVAAAVNLSALEQPGSWSQMFLVHPAACSEQCRWLARGY